MRVTERSRIDSLSLASSRKAERLEITDLTMAKTAYERSIAVTKQILNIQTQ